MHLLKMHIVIKLQIAIVESTRGSSRCESLLTAAAAVVVSSCSNLSNVPAGAVPATCRSSNFLALFLLTQVAGESMPRIRKTRKVTNSKKNKRSKNGTGHHHRRRSLPTPPSMTATAPVQKRSSSETSSTKRNMFVVVEAKGKDNNVVLLLLNLLIHDLFLQ